MSSFQSAHLVFTSSILFCNLLWSCLPGTKENIKGDIIDRSRTDSKEKKRGWGGGGGRGDKGRSLQVLPNESRMLLVATVLGRESFMHIPLWQLAKFPFKFCKYFILADVG